MVLLNEAEFANRQKDDLMADQSLLGGENEKANREQLELLTRKMKEYRIRSKELEGLLMESDSRRIEQRKELEKAIDSELRAKLEVQTLGPRCENAEKSRDYFQKKAGETEGRIE